MSFTRVLVSLAAAAGLLLVPLGANAAETLRTVNYRTDYHLTHPMPSAGEYTGRMTLHFYADGTVNGTYRDEFQNQIHLVTGAVRGSTLWLSFGSRGHQFNGTIAKGGIISGSLTNWRGPNVYQFTAVPAAT